MGYRIFGQKVTGIQDIKTPPNGASHLLKSVRFYIGFPVVQTDGWMDSNLVPRVGGAGKGPGIGWSRVFSYTLKSWV